MATYKGYQMDDNGNMLLPIGADVAPVERTSKASKAYAKGDYLFYNNNFYKVTSAIASGGTITPGSNCTATTVAAELKGSVVSFGTIALLGTVTASASKTFNISNYNLIGIFSKPDSGTYFEAAYSTGFIPKEYLKFIINTTGMTSLISNGIGKITSISDSSITFAAWPSTRSGYIYGANT